MEITQDTLKELIGESDISSDAVLKIKIMVENAIAERLEEQSKALAAEHVEAVAALETKITEAETAHAAQLAEAAAQLEEATEAHEAEALDLAEKANQYAQYVVSEMTEKIDAYAEYVVEKFIEDNKQTLVESDEYSRMKSVFATIKEAFEAAHFDLTPPADEVTEIEGKLEEAKGAYNDVFTKYQAVVAENEEMQFAMIFEHLTKDLADTQKEKLKTLVENVSFEGVAEFKRGVELMIGQVTESSKSATEDGKEDAIIVEDVSAVAPAEVVQPANESMQRYLKLL